MRVNDHERNTSICLVILSLFLVIFFLLFSGPGKADACDRYCCPPDGDPNKAIAHFYYIYSDRATNTFVYNQWCEDYSAACSGLNYYDSGVGCPGRLSCDPFGCFEGGNAYLIKSEPPESHVYDFHLNSPGYCLYCEPWPDLGGGGGCGNVVCPGNMEVQADCSCACPESCSQEKVRASGDSCDCSCRPVQVTDDLSVNSICENGFFTYAFNFVFKYTDTNEVPTFFPYASEVQMHKGNSCTGSGETSSCAAWEAFGSGESGTWWNDFPDGVYKWHMKILNSCGELVTEYDRFYNHKCECACSDPVPGGPPVF